MKSRLIALRRALRGPWIGFVGLASACAVLTFSALQVRAAGAPLKSPLVYSGVLEEGEKPVSGARMIGIRLFDAAMGGAEQCAAAPVAVEVKEGRFSVLLADACSTAIHDHSDLWVELQIDGNALLPRAKLGAVPYALEAARAVDAAGALRDELNAAQSKLASLESRVALAEQKSRPRVVLTRDERGGCPPPQAADTDILSHAFSTAAPATIHTSANIIANTTGRQDLALYVDGIEVDRTLASPNGGGGDGWVGMQVDVALEVGPGDHTVSLRSTAADIYGCGAGWGHLQTLIYE